MRLHSSLRVRLIAWFVGVAALIVLVVSSLALAVVYQVAVTEARQSLGVAASETPTLIIGYLEKHLDWDGLQPYLLQKLAPLGVVAHVEPRGQPFTALQQMAPYQGFFSKTPSLEWVPYELFRAPAGSLQGATSDTGSLSIVIKPPGLGPPPVSVWQQLGRPQAVDTTPLATPFVGPAHSFPLFLMLASRIEPQHLRFADRDILLFITPMHFAGVLERSVLAVGLLALLAMLIAWRIAIVAARHTLDPLVRTTTALERFGDGDFADEPVQTNDQTELGNLARAYNRAVAQITHAFDERSKTAAEMRQFVADAGHQLRTPLTVIMGHLSALVGKTTDPRETRVVASMLDHSRRMKILIDDLITLAKLEDGETVAREPIDANRLCATVRDSLEGERAARVVFQPASTPVLVNGSESELFAAVTELVENALKYAHSGPVELSVAVERGRCVISVGDRGSGMSAEELEKAFDRFYRGENAYGIEGTGLGLAIVRRAVQRAGGAVLLVNRPDGGLRSMIVLPLAATAKAEAPAQTAAVPARRARALAAPRSA